jgi:hypothetical protein
MQRLEVPVTVLKASVHYLHPLLVKGPHVLSACRRVGECLARPQSQQPGQTQVLGLFIRVVNHVAWCFTSIAAAFHVAGWAV